MHVSKWFMPHVTRGVRILPIWSGGKFLPDHSVAVHLMPSQVNKTHQPAVQEKNDYYGCLRAQDWVRQCVIHLWCFKRWDKKLQWLYSSICGLQSKSTLEIFFWLGTYLDSLCIQSSNAHLLASCCSKSPHWRRSSPQVAIILGKNKIKTYFVKF